MPKACGKLCAYGACIDETVNGISGSLPPAGPPSSNWEFTTKSRPRTSALFVGLAEGEVILHKHDPGCSRCAHISHQ